MKFFAPVAAFMNTTPPDQVSPVIPHSIVPYVCLMKGLKSCKLPVGSGSIFHPVTTSGVPFAFISATIGGETCDENMAVEGKRLRNAPSPDHQKPFVTVW